MRVIFLDIDGVLNNNKTRTTTSDGWCFVDDELVTRLKKLVDATNAKIVLSSTWREGWHREDETLNDISFTELRTKFREFGLSIMSRTCDSWAGSTRGDEIQEFISRREDIESFIIIDDWVDMSNLIDRLVKISPTTGLTDKDVEHAIELMETPREELTVYDVLRNVDISNGKPISVMYRCNYPNRLLHDLDSYEIEEGLLQGYCTWDGKELVPCDDDEYSLHDCIYKYEINLHSVIVWVETEWYGDDE